jgi:hypothetical protein
VKRIALATVALLAIAWIGWQDIPGEFLQRPRNRVSDYGAIPNDGKDDLAAIQKCIVACRNYHDVVFDPGQYHISDTIHVTTGSTADGSNGFDSIEVVGAGGVGWESGSASVQIVTDFATNDRPAISIQGARHVKIKGIEIIGENTAAKTLYDTGQTALSADVDDWVSAGCSNTRYAPYAGIAIDGYSGTEPVGGYTNADYSRVDSIDVVLEDVVIRQFVVGVAVKPSDDQDNAEYMTFHRVMMRHCAYGMSIGAAQDRIFTASDCYFWNNHTCMEGGTHGRQQGSPPHVDGGGAIWSYRIFRFLNGFGNVSMNGFYAEVIEQIGMLGVGGSSLAHPASITGSHFKFRNVSTAVDANDAPYHLVANMPVHFSGTTFSMANGVFNAVSALNIPILYDSCNFNDISANWSDIFYVGYNASWASPKSTLRGCEYRTNSYTAFTKWNCADTESYVTTVPARFDLSAHSRTVYGPATSYGVEFGVGGSSHTQVSASASGYSWTGDEVEFTAGTAGEFQVGDKLFWRTVADADASSSQFITLALKVTNVTGTTITAESLFGEDFLDQAYAPSSVGIAYKPYAHGLVCTGTTNTSTSITNVANAESLFKVGDWIAGTGIPAKTRVTVVSGTTLTISKAATATADYIHLYSDHAWRADVPRDTPDAMWATRDATTDLKAIMAQLDYRGECRLLGGSYWLGSGETITTPAGSLLHGAGMQQTLLVPLTGCLLPISVGQRATVRDLYIDGTDEASSVGIQFASTNAVVERAQVVDMAKGVIFPDSLVSNRLLFSRLSSCATAGAEVNAANNSSIAGTSFESCGIGVNAIGTANGLAIDQCQFSGSGTLGVSLAGSIGSPSVTSGYFSGNTTADIGISGNIRAGVITGCRFDSSATCVTTSNGNDVSIFGNTFNGTVSLKLTNAAATRYDIGPNTYLTDEFDLATDNSGTRTRYLGSIYSSGTPNGTGPWALGEIVYHSAPASGVTPMGWVCTVGHASSATFVALPTIP